MATRSTEKSDRNPVPIVGEPTDKHYCPDCGSVIEVDAELEPGDEVECVRGCEVVLASVDPVVLELGGEEDDEDDDEDEDDEEGVEDDDDEDYDDDLDDDYVNDDEDDD